MTVLGSQLRNVLVMRLDNIGDVLMTSPALRSLREFAPEAKLTLMASPGGSLAASLLPWIDEVLPQRVVWQDLGRLPFNPVREWELISTLRSRSFDAAILFTSFSQSPFPPALICTLAGIPVRVGESKETARSLLTHSPTPAPDELHQVDRNLRLVESLGIAVRDRSLAIEIPSAAHDILDSLTQPFIVLNPWTSCPSRNYDAERFAIAARRLSEETGFAIVVTGVENDRSHSESVLEILGDRGIDFIGKTTLAELAAIISKARLMLSNNTSTMHIADATRTPSVILFAGTELECQWEPRSTRSRLLRQPTDCSPCYRFTCPYELECLEIEPDAIVQAGLALLAECPSHSIEFSIEK